MAFLDFEYFCRDLISNNITLDNIDNNRRNQLEKLVNTLYQQIQKQRTKDRTNTKKPKHMKNQTREEKPKENVTPRHFKNQTPKNTFEEKITSEREMSDLTEEDRQIMIDNIVQNNNEEKPKTL